MKKIPAKALCAYALAAVGGGYVYGSKGERCTPSLRESCAAANPSQKKNILEVSAKWDYNYNVWDCSGIMRGAWQKLSGKKSGGATSIYRDWCTRKGPIETMPEVPGVLVFHGKVDAKGKPDMSHVGVYIGNGMVVDARGSREGVLYGTKESYKGKWSHWAMPDDVDYENTQPQEPEPEQPALWTGHVKTKTGNGISLWTDATKDKRVCTVPEGAEVDVLEDTDRRGFATCRYSGNVGLADMQYIVPTDGEEPDMSWYRARVKDVKTGLNLRSSPVNASANTILLMPLYAAVDVLAIDGDFAHVLYNGVTGYATESYLERMPEEVRT